MNRPQWIEALFLPCAVVTLTVAWLSLWLEWVTRLATPGQPRPSYFPFALAAVMLAGAAATHWTLRRKWPLPRARSVVGVGGAVAALLAAWLAAGPRFTADYLRGRPGLTALAFSAFSVLCAAAYLWWRGIHLGRSSLTHHDLTGVFYRGVTALTLLLCLNSLRPLLPAADFLNAILLFFAIGLGGLAVASFKRLRLQQRRVTATRLALDRYWLATVAAVIGAVLLGGLVTARLLAPEALEGLRRFVERVMDLAAFVALLVVAPVALLVEWLLTPFFPAIRRFLSAVVALFQEIAEVLRGLFGGVLKFLNVRLPRLFSPEDFERFVNSPAVRTSSRWGILLVLLGVMGVVFWLAVRRLSGPAPLNADETRESILSRQLLWAQLKRLLARRRPQAASSPPPFLALSGPADDPRLIVRRAYQALLAWAQTVRPPRAPGQTPKQYAEGLTLAVPAGEEAITTLTEAYVRARYSAEAPAMEEARKAESAVSQLQALVTKSEAQR